MKEKFINSSINFIGKYQEIDDLKMKQLKYGLEGLYNLVIKLIIVIIIALITKTITYTLLYLLFYSGIRTFSYGWHAKGSLSCWITTILIYNIIPLFIKNLEIPNIYGYIILVISLLSVILWAPADTPKKPLIRKKQRTKLKVLSIVVVIIYTLIFIFSNNKIVNNSLLYALIIQSIFINPLTYKLTKTKFNNYKYYKKKIN